MPRPPIEVACFGEILWDIFERSPRGDEPIAWDLRRALGGAPANVATGLARLGVRSSVIGGIGKDRFGDALVRHLERDGVDTRFAPRLPNRTGLTFVTRDARGEPSFLFYRHESADVSMTRAHVTPAMGRATWVLFGTSTMMTPALAAATTAMLRVARAAGARVVLDLNVRKHLWKSEAALQRAVRALAKEASLVKASAADLAGLVGETSERKAMAWLRARAPRATWLVTRGPEPASAVGEHGEVTVPAPRASCVDATGAGDAFLAGSLAVLLAHDAIPGAAGWSDPRVFRRALEVGHAMSRKAISRPGGVTGLVGLEALRRRVREPLGAPPARRASARPPR